MIISLHIPKTAGLSFRQRLIDSYQDRIFLDYGDWVGLDAPEIVARRKAREAEMRTRRDELLRDYDIIHGHFVTDKYLGLFPRARFAAFFRDPFQQTMSHYEFFKRNPQIDNPGVALFHELNPTPAEFAALKPDIQCEYVGGLDVDDIEVVGLTESYERGVALFQAVFGRTLAPEVVRDNVNPDRPAEGYAVDPALKRAIETHRGRDIELYRRAAERFAALAVRYGV